MKSFDKIDGYKPHVFYEKEDRKERRNNDKEKRISVSIVILSFLSSVCALFGVLYPEFTRAELDMTKLRGIIGTAGNLQPHLIKDRITIVNLGMWRYCYDDQLYDLIELINFDVVGGNNNVDGDLAIRCHSMPDYQTLDLSYHLQNKFTIIKIGLIAGVVMCVTSFLISILVLITRLPVAKFILLVSCGLGLVALAVSLGVAITSQDDAQGHFNEYLGQVLGDYLNQEFGIDVSTLGIQLDSMELATFQLGVCAILLSSGTVIMFICLVFSEFNRQL